MRNSNADVLSRGGTVFLYSLLNITGKPEKNINSQKVSALQFQNLILIIKQLL